MRASEIINYLEAYFPLELQMTWDKCGIQVGNKDQDVTNIMIALNADCVSLKKAIEHNCQMLITHHPFMLEEIIDLDCHNHHGKFVEMAIKNDILVYSLHTCLDRGKDGISMNDWLINELGVHDVCSYDDFQVGKMGILNTPLQTVELVKKIKDIFKVPIRVAGKDKEIKTIAICGGSGADDLSHLANRVDAYITGDSKHRHAKYAIDHDIVLIDVPHHIEVIMEKKLQELLNNLNVNVMIAASQDYYKYY